MATSNHNSVPEGFKEIPLHEGRYFINEQGDVWSVARKRLMCPQTDATHLYPWVLVMENGKAQPRTVYYLMRLTWMPNAPGEVGTGRGKWCVNHKDGNKLNSHIDNLEWTTNEGNLSHAWRTGLRNNSIGENAPQSIFTSKQIRGIRLRIIEGEKVKTIANEFQVSTSIIKNIQKFYAWKHQDWDLIDNMMQVCKSKWLAETKRCAETGIFYSYSDVNKYK
jgi:hypothetical protein